MHSVVKKEGSTPMNSNARNAGGTRRGRNYSRGRPQRDPVTIFDIVDQAWADNMSTVPNEAPRRGRRRGGRNQHKPLGHKQTHIEDLNDDCLIHIFSFLPIVDRVRIKRVSKQWYTVSSLSWHTLKEMTLIENFWGVHYNKSRVTITRDVFQKVLKLCGYFLTHVDLTKDVIGRIPRIRVESCEAVLKIIDEMCPNLRSLIIERPTTHTALDYITDHFPRLTDLTMDVLTNHYNYHWAVINLLSSRRNLKYFKLRYFKISTTCLLDSNFENLEELHLQYCQFEAAESILNVIDKLKALHTLSLWHNDGKTEWEKDVLQALGKLTNLRRLNLEISVYLYSSIDTNFICSLTNLEELRLRGYGVANDEILDKISRACKNIKKLQLSFSNCVTDEGISYIGKFPRLEFLRFSTMNSLVGENLEKLSQIKYLECLDCPYVKNEGFLNLIAKSENIRWIKIFNCDKISEELIVQANNIASEKLYLTFDNSRLGSTLSKNKHSLNKVDNQITKKFEKLCIYCYKVPVKDCTYCYNKVEVF